MKYSPYGSPPSSFWNSDEILKFWRVPHQAGASNKRLVENNPFSSFKRQYLKNRSLMTNRKSHIMRFRLTPRSMTLNCYRFEFSENFAGYIDPHCQRQRCKPLNVLFKVMFLALICRRFFARGLYTRKAVALTLALARHSFFYSKRAPLPLPLPYHDSIPTEN